jgi:predicted small integral membrane protein
MNSRLIKIFFSCTVGLYVSLVCFNNITDYHSNFQFVSMVAKMDDTFSKENNGWRSIHSSIFHHSMFLFIIAWELAIAVLLLFGAFKMIHKFRSGAAEFITAKKYTATGLSLGVLLWFTVFIAIGGEWFLMWQSKNWNAQNTAFLLTCCFLLFLIHHNQNDT